MLIFDFDGVLLDSVDEMAVTAYNTVTETLVTALDDLPGNAAGLFRTNRFHIQTAGDALTLMQWCLDHADQAEDHRMSLETYQARQRDADEPIFERTARFFATRKRFVDHDVERWRALNRIYQPLWDILVDRGAERVIILTNKNREATVNLCRHFGLQVLPENLYSGDHSVTKIENLLQIQARFPQPQHIFLDDSIHNLRELDVHFNAERPMLKLLLASWGYIGPDDAATAKAYDYAFATQQDVIGMLDTELPAVR